MPPASRGLLFFRVFRPYSRCANLSSKLPTPKAQKSSSKPRTIPVPASNVPSSQTLPKSLPSEPVVKPTGRPTSQPLSLLRRYVNHIPLRFRKWLVRGLLFTPPLALLFLHFPLEIMWVNGPSMSPFLNPNSSPELPQTQDCVLVQKVIFPDRNAIGMTTPTMNFQRGQIVVFYTPHDPEKIAVKRVIGIAGDRITPFQGYPGGDGSVVIPYNHLWLEGDVNDRDKSIDSNWYGPISQNLVIGVVRVVLTPWYSPSVVRWQIHTYPAKQKRRVEENVVNEATIDPDTKAAREAFMNGAAMAEIANLQRHKLVMPKLLKEEGNRFRANQIYVQAQEELAKQDPWSMELATELIKELEAAFLRAGLTNDGQLKLISTAETEDHADLRTDVADKAAGPAKKALAKYLEKQKRIRKVEEAQMDLLDQERRGVSSVKSVATNDTSRG